MPSLDEFEAAIQENPNKTVIVDGVEQNWCLVPKCPDCGAEMKPHTMFTDEAFSEHYYQRDTVLDLVKKSDCLVVIGSSVKTNLAKQIVANFLDNELPVIEINLESQIGRGRNIQVL